MITRKHCPGPWHLAVAAHYEELAKLAPATAAHYVAHKYNVAFPWQVPIIAAWVRERPYLKPCPVAI